MLALGAALLLSVASANAPAVVRADAAIAAAPPVALSAATASTDASTYEQAACEPGDSGECAPEEAASPSLPAILDCNDARLGAFMQEMIGTCDMPKPSPPTARTPTLQKAAGGSRLCDGLCAPTSDPLRPLPRLTDDAPPLAASALLAADPFPASALPARVFVRPSDAPADRLERPPRA